ncbi:hypothetical protein [Endozoicomonas atrinae]|uniref:hypothetical protein n=1 Tax=Endozoicomonas atrinae TaxID=1333660 RepID=UPI003AFFCD1F
MKESQQLAGMLNFSTPVKGVPQSPVTRATNDRATQVSPEGIALAVLIMPNNSLDGGSIGFGDFHNDSPSLVRFYFCFLFNLLAIRWAFRFRFLSVLDGRRLVNRALSTFPPEVPLALKTITFFPD